MRICMASDFFYPNMGGVEEHIFNLSQCLLSRGNKVIVITHSYGDRQGIRYMTNGLKIYYLPIRTMYNQCILPTMVANIPILRNILLRERIQVVHGHSAFSALAHEAMSVGRLLGLRVVFTDHSLFGFADLSAVLTNKLLQITLSNCNHCICVSHTGKENTVLRAKVLGSNVSVIPNAVDTAHFTPNPRRRPTNDQITVVIISRLVYRKGVDLMAGVIAKMNHMKNVNFLVGGDGPKRGLLEEVREKANMQDRVQMLGALEHAKGSTVPGMLEPSSSNRLCDELSESCRPQDTLNVRDVLTQGHIFVNTSLTEAYCMAIVEAASCGLQVVTTRVGGIPEVLPTSLTILTEPTVESVYDGLMLAIQRQIHRRGLNQNGFNGSHPTEDSVDQLLPQNTTLANPENLKHKKSTTARVLCPFECNDTVRQLYNWDNVAERTERVYRHVLDQSDPPFGEKLRMYGIACGSFMVVVAAMLWFLKLLNWMYPSELIDDARDFPRPLAGASSDHQTSCSTTNTPFTSKSQPANGEIKRRKRK